MVLNAPQLHCHAEEATCCKLESEGPPPTTSSHHRVYAGWSIKANPNTVSRLRSLTLTGLRLSIQSPPERGQAKHRFARAQVQIGDLRAAMNKLPITTALHPFPIQEFKFLPLANLSWIQKPHQLPDLGPWWSSR